MHLYYSSAMYYQFTFVLFDIIDITLTACLMIAFEVFTQGNLTRNYFYLY